MTVDQFEILNKAADDVVATFNAQHAGQERFIKNGSDEKEMVKGLNKHLTINGQIPSTPPITNPKHLTKQSILSANHILYSVSFESGILVMLPVFVSANVFEKK